MASPVKRERIKAGLAKQPAHMARVASLGCVVCGAPAEVHHVRTGNQARDDARVVGLCPLHHRDGKVGFHGLGNENRFYEVHGVCLSFEAEKLAEESTALGLMK